MTTGPNSTFHADAAGARATMVLRDRVDPWQVAALHATLGRPGPAPAEGEALPPLWHFILFREARPRAELGRDGHPKLGGFIPDFGLPRRMWAGGRLRFHAPLKLGQEATRTSTILDTALKDGRSGRLAFVTLLHRVEGPDGLAVEEEQDLVYREEHDPNGPPPPKAPDAPAGGEWMTEMTADPTLLFRYSALTFNGHRIHYDLAHATKTEGYGGLVVHGPMLAQLMADLARECSGRALAEFSFRGVSPVIHTQPFEVCGAPEGDGAKLWIRAPGGRLAMKGEARFA
ncbi:FAS1-like dehydratase domain-containing protein [Rhodovulum sp. DZ06]|uniref:FAS1-like dehydratase domain-containing protein n=1 Tax=Rhodovulum sp. DZ06 TaxID=3425126 RepID=UPI003D340A3F